MMSATTSAAPEVFCCDVPRCIVIIVFFLSTDIMRMALRWFSGIFIASWAKGQYWGSRQAGRCIGCQSRTPSHHQDVMAVRLNDHLRGQGWRQGGGGSAVPRVVAGSSLQTDHELLEFMVELLRHDVAVPRCVDPEERSLQAHQHQLLVQRHRLPHWATMSPSPGVSAAQARIATGKNAIGGDIGGREKVD